MAGGMRPTTVTVLSVLVLLALLGATSAAVAGHGKKEREEKAGERDGHGDRETREHDDEREEQDTQEREPVHRTVERHAVRHARVAAAPEPKATSPDASVQVLVTPRPGALLVSLLAARPVGDAATVSLQAELPDVGSDWTLETPAVDGAAPCTLDGAHASRLSCSLPLAAGEAALVQATARLAAVPGWAIEASAHVAAPGDGVAGNDAAAAQAGLLLL
jgi:hypothetical protein